MSRSKTIKRGSRSKKKPRQSTQQLSEQLYSFLLDHQYMCKDIAEGYKNNQRALFDDLRNENTTERKHVIKPKSKLTRELFEACCKKFGKDTRDDTAWPAGDYANWGEFYNNCDLEIWKYTEVKGGIAERGNRGLCQAMWICFVVPYILCLYSLDMDTKDRFADTYKGVFVFVYRGGGAGCLVEYESNTYAISCGHTFEYTGKYTAITKRGGYLVMFSNGTLGLIQIVNEKLFENDYDDDFGIATVIKHAGDLHPRPLKDISKDIKTAFTGRSGRGNSKEEAAKKLDKKEIVCIGSPSEILTRKECGGTEENDAETIQVPGLSKKDKTNEICFWSPSFFFAVQPGEITAMDKNLQIYHTAVLWEGMSGGPLINNNGDLLGMHVQYSEETGTCVGNSTNYYINKLSGYQ